MNLLKYSNGWGHLIVSLAMLAVGVYLVTIHQEGYGIGLISSVAAAWFIPGSAKQVAAEVEKNTNQPAAQSVQAAAAAVQTAAAIMASTGPLPAVTPPQQGANSNAANSAS